MLTFRHEYVDFLVESYPLLDDITEDEIKNMIRIMADRGYLHVPEVEEEVEENPEEPEIVQAVGDEERVLGVSESSLCDRVYELSRQLTSRPVRAFSGFLAIVRKRGRLACVSYNNYSDAQKKHVEKQVHSLEVLMDIARQNRIKISRKSIESYGKMIGGKVEMINRIYYYDRKVYDCISLNEDVVLADYELRLQLLSREPVRVFVNGETFLSESVDEVKYFKAKSTDIEVIVESLTERPASKVFLRYVWVVHRIIEPVRHPELRFKYVLRNEVVVRGGIYCHPYDDSKQEYLVQADMRIFDQGLAAIRRYIRSQPSRLTGVIMRSTQGIRLELEGNRYILRYVMFQVFRYQLYLIGDWDPHTWVDIVREMQSPFVINDNYPLHRSFLMREMDEYFERKHIGFHHVYVRDDPLY